jgi:hypothetical protein
MPRPPPAFRLGVVLLAEAPESANYSGAIIQDEQALPDPIDCRIAQIRSACTIGACPPVR